jgi:hypothetical protein
VFRDLGPQSASLQGLARSVLLPAMIAYALLQQAGFTLNPF